MQHPHPLFCHLLPHHTPGPVRRQHLVARPWKVVGCVHGTSCSWIPRPLRAHSRAWLALLAPVDIPLVIRTVVGSVCIMRVLVACSSALTHSARWRHRAMLPGPPIPYVWHALCTAKPAPVRCKQMVESCVAVWGCSPQSGMPLPP
eukprot:jgi/Mesvir1/12598/Mv25717-RA.1